MANYNDIGISDVAFIAGEDLTQKQFYFVMPGSVAGEVMVATGTCNPAPYGILQNSPSVGQEATVRMYGFSKLVVEAATCTVTWMKYVLCASDGQGEAVATTGCPVNARYVDTASVLTGSAKAHVQIITQTASFAAQT